MEGFELGRGSPIGWTQIKMMMGLYDTQEGSMLLKCWPAAAASEVKVTTKRRSLNVISLKSMETGLDQQNKNDSALEQDETLTADNLPSRILELFSLKLDLKSALDFELAKHCPVWRLAQEVEEEEVPSTTNWLQMKHPMFRCLWSEANVSISFLI